MLLIGSAKIKFLQEKLEGFEYKNVRFSVRKKVGLSLLVSHTAENDKVAKALLKEIIKSFPEMKNIFSSIQIVDENGHLV